MKEDTRRKELKKEKGRNGGSRSKEARVEGRKEDKNKLRRDEGIQDRTEEHEGKG